MSEVALHAGDETVLPMRGQGRGAGAASGPRLAGLVRVKLERPCAAEVSEGDGSFWQSVGSLDVARLPACTVTVQYSMCCCTPEYMYSTLYSTYSIGALLPVASGVVRETG